MDWNRYGSPNPSEGWPPYATRATPPTAAKTPLSVYRVTVTARTGTPARNAARALFPTAYTRRPNVVSVNSTVTNSTTPPHTSNSVGMPAVRPTTRRRNGSGAYDAHDPHVSPFDRPSDRPCMTPF